MITQISLRVWVSEYIVRWSLTYFSKCMGCINVSWKLVAAVAVMLKVGRVGFVCESCPMLGFCTTIKKFQVYSNGGVFSVSGFCYSALQSFKCMCVWSVDTRVHTQSSLSVLTHSAQLFYLHCTLVCLFIRKTRLLSSTHPIFALATVQIMPWHDRITNTRQVCE